MIMNRSIDSSNRTGLHRGETHIPLLLPEAIKLDNRNFLDFIRMVRVKSQAMPFANQKNVHWYHFFEQNPLFILSEINDWPIDEWLVEFDTLKTIRAQTEAIINVAKQWDNWLHRAASPSVIDLAKELRMHLRQEVQKHWLPIISQLQGDEKHSAACDSIGFFKKGGSSSALFMGGLHEPDPKFYVRQVEEAFRTIRLKVPTLIDEIMQHDGLHQPQIGALMAFIKANNLLQEQFNGLAEKHIDYFYRNILKQSNKPAQSDRVALCLNPVNNTRNDRVKKGTRVIAGIYDNGQDIEYALNQDLEISQTKINSIRQVYIARNPAVGITNQFEFISGIYCRELNIQDDGFIYNESENRQAIPVFGSDQIQIDVKQRSMHAVNLGFVVANPILFLSEGRRTIQFLFEVETDSLSALVSYIEALSKERNIGADAAFQLMMEGIFKIEYSTPEGWNVIDRYGIKMKGAWSDATIQIDIELTEEHPEISALDMEVHGTEYQESVGLPHMRFILRQEGRLFGYSFVKDLVIKAVDISVHVNSMQNLYAFNANTDLDVQTAFSPFISPINNGAFLCVGHPELAAKKLTSISLDVQWLNVPQLKGGLSTYFNAYGSVINNEDYTFSLSLKSERNFKPVESEETVQIFEENEAQIIKKHSHYAPKDFSSFQYSPLYKLPDTVGRQSAAGVIRLTLNTPDLCFGDRDYAKVLSSVMVKNATEKNPDKHKELPNLPLNPEVESIALNYSANERVEWVEERQSLNHPEGSGLFYHINPFETKLIFKNGKTAERDWLPQYQSNGYLYVSLSDIESTDYLSLYIQTKESKEGGRNQNQKPDVIWQFFSAAGWVNFKDSDLIMDGTNGLKATGIIQLKVPELLKQGSTQSNSTWLIRATTNASSENYPEILFLKNNAIYADWVRPNEETEWPGQLNSNSIERFVEQNNAITSIDQPFPSFSGSPRESRDDFYDRISHRIRHKNRPVRPTEIESYVMDEYPEIFQTRCFTATEHGEAGKIKLVCVPKINVDEAFYLPSLPEALRYEIQSDVESRISEGYDIQVINPKFEHLRINAHVALVDGADRGQSLVQVSEQIQNYLCPWFNRSQNPMHFGWIPTQEALFNELEKLPLLRFISAFSIVLIQQTENGTLLFDSARKDINYSSFKLSKPWSVIVPDRRQGIDIIEQTEHSKATPLQLSQMQIGEDFILEESNSMPPNKQVSENEPIYRIIIK